MNQTPEVLPDVLAAFDGYEWTKSGSQPTVTPEMTAAIDALAAGAVPESLTKEQTLRLFKAGTYKLHERSSTPGQKDKDIAAAERLLTAAYHVSRANPSLELGDDYYRIGNNLAYAAVNAKGAKETDLARAEGYLEETLGNTHNVDIASFAMRIQGQADFRRAQNADIPDDKYRLVKQGIEKCLDGVAELDPAQEVSEIARTHNRNAVELFDLLALNPPRTQQVEILDRAWKESRTAQALWQNFSAPEEFTGFKERTAGVANDIADYAKKHGFRLPAAAVGRFALEVERGTVQAR